MPLRSGRRGAGRCIPVTGWLRGQSLSAELGWYREVLASPLCVGAEFLFFVRRCRWRIGFVDVAADPRSGQFAYFRAMADPWAGITVPVDITAFHDGGGGADPFSSAFSMP